MHQGNQQQLQKLYDDFARGDTAAFLAGCEEKITFQLAGKSPVAGKYTKANFGQFVSRLMDLSGGTFKLEVHDILASDRHGTVLTTANFTRNGKSHQLRAVHVWRFEKEKPVAWYEYARDLHQSDLAWGG